MQSLVPSAPTAAASSTSHVGGIAPSSAGVAAASHPSQPPQFFSSRDHTGNIHPAFKPTLTTRPINTCSVWTVNDGGEVVLRPYTHVDAARRYWVFMTERNAFVAAGDMAAVRAVDQLITLIFDMGVFRGLLGHASGLCAAVDYLRPYEHLAVHAAGPTKLPHVKKCLTSS